MSRNCPPAPAQILLVEDNPGDVRLIQEAFKQTDAETTFHTVHDGEPALETLRTHQHSASHVSLDLILLDLNLPRMGGLEVLERIQNDPELDAPPILVLTSSNADADITASYELGANAFLTKPSDPTEFTKLGNAVDAFWFKQATLPPASVSS